MKQMFKSGVSLLFILILLSACSLLNNKTDDVVIDRLDIEFTLNFVRAFSMQSIEDQKTDLNYLSQNWSKKRTTDTRIKLALALSHAATTLRDDHKALQLLEEGERPEKVSIRLAIYLQSIRTLLTERIREKKEDDRKYLALQQKLDVWQAKSENYQQKIENLQQKVENLQQKAESLQLKNEGLQQRYDQVNIKNQALQKKLEDLREIERANINPKRLK